MATVKENLIAARATFEANAPRWTLHQSVDYTAGESDEGYSKMMAALQVAMPQVPTPITSNIVRWSKTVAPEAIIALFDRAIGAQQ